MLSLSRLRMFCLLAGPPTLIISMSWLTLAKGGMITLLAVLAAVLAVVMFVPKPYGALIDRRSALALVVVGTLPLVSWIGLSVLIFPDVRVIEVTLKFLLVFITPIAVCTKWSVMHVIALASVLGGGSYARILPAACEQTMLHSPFWIHEAREIEPVLRHASINNQSTWFAKFNSVISVVTLFVLMTIDAMTKLHSDKSFVILPDVKSELPEIPDKNSLFGHWLLLIAIFFILFLSKI